MELPTDVWDIIVKQSIKTDNELIKNKKYHELIQLEKIIAYQKNILNNELKATISNNDIIQYHPYNGDKMKFDYYLVIANKHINNQYIAVVPLANDFPTINLEWLREEKKHLCINDGKITIINTLKSRTANGYEVANKLKKGDVFRCFVNNIPNWICESDYYFRVYAITNKSVKVKIGNKFHYINKKNVLSKFYIIILNNRKVLSSDGLIE